jgi:hypothetical protein
MVVGDMNICTGAHRGPMYGLLAEAMAGAGVGVGEYPIVTPVRGELKTNRPYGLSLSGFYFYRGPVTGVTIGYSPRSVRTSRPGWLGPATSPWPATPSATPCTCSPTTRLS